VGAGLIETLAICSPVDGETRGWVQVLSLGILVLALDSINRKGDPLQDKTAQKINSAMFVGFAFSAAWLASTFWWIYISLHVYGGMHEILATLSVLLLAGGLGIYYAIACTVYVRLAAYVKEGFSCLLFGSLWTLAELARAQWFTGFPWAAIGYAHLNDSLKLLAPYCGVYGIGFVAATLACALSKMCFKVYEKIKNKTRNFDLKYGVWAALIIVMIVPNNPIVIWVEGEEDKRIELTAVTSYALLQGNVPQNVKFEAEGLKALDWYKNEIISSNAQWVITPETAIPVLKEDLPREYWAEIINHFKDGRAEKGKALMLGIIGQASGAYTNRVVGINKEGESYVYDKHHLVPFGEFIPAWFKWFTDLMKIPLGSFKRGEIAQAPWQWNDQIIAMNICYEDVFGEELAASFVKEGVNSPTLLVNVSNIGWFGQYMAVEQHLNASRMRAVELKRPMLRATNTGATAAIDHNGNVLALLPKGTAGVLTGSIHGVKAKPTFYAQWSGRYSLYPLWLLCLFIVLLEVGTRFGKFKKLGINE